MNKKIIAIFLSSFALFACDHQALPNNPETASDPDEGKYHENIFSLDTGMSGGSLKKESAQAKLATTFKNEDDYRKALNNLLEKLKSKTYTRALNKPIDYRCDELDLAIFQDYGEVTINSKVYFNEKIMRDHCQKKDSNPVLSKSAAASLPPAEAVDTQYPYRMIGHSWSNNNYLVYKSTGGETSFEKRRRKFYTTGWWNLDADLIGTRIYLFECPDVSNVQGMSTTCFDSENRSISDWDSNDDYVSVRDWSVGLKASFSFSGWVPTGLTYYTTPSILIYPNNSNSDWYSYYQSGGRPVYHVRASVIDWAQSAVDKTIAYIGLGFNVTEGVNFVNGLGAQIVPQISGAADMAGIAGGVLSMHSVRHGSMNFRGVSSAGLREHLVYKWPTFDFVTW